MWQDATVESFARWRCCGNVWSQTGKANKGTGSVRGACHLIRLPDRGMRFGDEMWQDATVESFARWRCCGNVWSQTGTGTADGASPRLLALLWQASRPKKGLAPWMETVPFLSTPRWARTSNLRFRRPMLYPIELGVQRAKV